MITQSWLTVYRCSAAPVITGTRKMAGEWQVNFSSQIYLSGWFFICAFLAHPIVVCTCATRLIDVWLVHRRHLKSSKSVRGHECMTRLTLSPAFSEKDRPTVNAFNVNNELNNSKMDGDEDEGSMLNKDSVSWQEIQTGEHSRVCCH